MKNYKELDTKYNYLKTTMKILFPIGAFYPSQIGGPCNTLYWHTVALSNKGMEVTIVTTSKGITENEVSRYTFKKMECGNVYYGGRSSASFHTIFTTLMAIKNTDILHLNSLFNPISIISFFYARIFFPNKKLVWSVRGETHPSALKYSNWKKRPLIHFYQRFCENILFHSTSTKESDSIKNLFPSSKVLCIPNLIKRSSRHLVSKQNKLLFIGRIHPIKALDKLIKALSKSSTFMSSDFQMEIAGVYEKRHREYFENLARIIIENKLEQKVIFSGFLTGKEKEKTYAESYFLILPSESENFGNVVIEALNQGTPVIASLGTPWEILESHKAGFHCENDPEILSKFIEKALNLPKAEYLKYSNNAIRLVDQEFDVDTQIHQWIDSYKSIENFH